jgi:cytochrome c peroxidase
MSNAAQTVAAIGLTVALVLTSTQAGRTQQTLSALPTVAAAPADNPTTPDKVELGRLLFWDPILSGQQDVACATCHHPDFGYAENLDVSIGTSGIGLGASRRFAPGSTTPHVKRNSQTILNAAFNGIDAAGRYDPVRAPMFWDARVQSLEAQSLEPIKALEEMRGTAYPEDVAVETVLTRLRAIPEYVMRFQDAFGAGTLIDASRLAQAIAAFERTLVAMDSPFDRFRAGDRSALTPQQQRGLETFDDVGCDRCHDGPMFSEFDLNAEGVPEHPLLSEPDAGDGRFRFRTPTLRNVALTAPYMHNGTLATLEDVLRFYDNGRSENPNVSAAGGRRRDDGLARLDRSFQRVDDMSEREVQDIIAFLESLTDSNFDRTIPARVPSGLPPGGLLQNH